MKRMLTAIAATLALAAGTPAAAVDLEEETETVETVRVESESEGITSVVEYTFDNPTVLDDEVIAELAGDPEEHTVLLALNNEGEEVYSERGAGVAETGTISPRAHLSLLLPCNRAHTATVGVTIFTIQRACNGTTAPWGLRLTPAFQATTAPTVTERGMMWWVNGVKRPNQSPHVNYPRGYQFHGTFSSVSAGNLLVLDDNISGRHVVVGGGNFVVTFSGSVTLSNTPKS